MMMRVMYMLAKLKAGDRDGSELEYLEWQQELNERDAAERLADTERKYLTLFPPCILGWLNNSGGSVPSQAAGEEGAGVEV
jgi:hypothetical protein